MKERNKLFRCFKLSYTSNPWALGLLPPEWDSYRSSLGMRDWQYFQSWTAARDWANEKWKEMQQQ